MLGDLVGSVVSLGADAAIWSSGGGAAIGVASLFLRSRAGKWTMLGVGGLLIVGGSYVMGRIHEAADSKRDALEARIAILQFELQTANELAALGFAQMQRQEQASAQLHQLQKDYDAHLASKPNPQDDGCTLDRDDVRWMCRIHGGC